MNTKQDLIDLLSRPDIEIEYLGMTNELVQIPDFEGKSFPHFEGTGKSKILIHINRITSESKEPKQ